MYSPKESTANSPQAGIPSWPRDLSINDQFACHPHKSLPKVSQPRTGGSGFEARVCGDSLEPCRRVSCCSASKPQQILPPARDGTRHSDTLAELIWHTCEQVTWLSIFNGNSAFILLHKLFICFVIHSLSYPPGEVPFILKNPTQALVAPLCTSLKHVYTGSLQNIVQM